MAMARARSSSSGSTQQSLVQLRDCGRSDSGVRSNKTAVQLTKDVNVNGDAGIAALFGGKASARRASIHDGEAVRGAGRGGSGRSNKSNFLRDMEASIQKLLTETHSNLDFLSGAATAAAVNDGELQQQPTKIWSGDGNGKINEGTIDTESYPWLAAAGSTSVASPTVTASPLHVRRNARIADLRDRDKAKIAKLVQQVLKLNQDNEALRTTAEEKAQTFREESKALRDEAGSWKVKHDEIRTKFGQSLTMLKSYQDKIFDMQRSTEAAEAEEIKQLKDQVMHLTTAVLERQQQEQKQAQENEQQELPQDGVKERNTQAVDPSSRKQVLVLQLEATESALESERALVAAAVKESEQARARFDDKLHEHLAIRAELEEAINADQSRCTGSLPDIRERLRGLLGEENAQQESQGMSKALLAVGAKLASERRVNDVSKERKQADEEEELRVEKSPRSSLEEQEDDIFEDFLRHQRQRQAKSNCDKKSKHAPFAPPADDDYNYDDEDFDENVLEVETNSEEEYQDKLDPSAGREEKKYNTRLRQTTRKWDDGVLTKSVDVWSEADSQLFESDPNGVLDAGAFENSNFETSLFDVIDELENSHISGK